MISLLHVFHRRSDLSLEECQRYWREIHTPLALRHAPALRVLGYVQAHTIEHPLADAVRASRADIEPYDGVAEFSWKDREDLTTALHSPEGKTAAAKLIENERRFIDHSRSSLWLAKKHVFIDREPENKADQQSSITTLFFAFRRLPSLSLEECQSYWRQTHGALVLQHAAAFPLRRYVQAHTMTDPLNDVLRASRGAMEPYDCVAQMDADLGELVTAASTPQGQRAAEEFLADERRFIDPARSSLWLAKREVVITPPPQPLSAGAS